MMSETVVTMDGSSNNTSNNPRQVPTVKTEPGQPNPLAGIRLNALYFKTIPGIIKLVQLGLGIICMACASPAYIGATHWFLFVVVMSFISTLIWCAVYFLSLRETLKIPINWILTELLNTAIKTVLYMIAFIAQLSAWTALRNSSSHIAAGIFGIFNTLAYAAGTYFLYIEWKSTNTQ
ncbi:CKLF-like MARVEL transmembrane domain-containing protein 8 [Pseudomyrmex gracilis]|uniref:CKLF-like MARVEL transmembrane domain-containing protein 8 n=1 Tax=Pseudomyrmex gracilis TaxID=219809 RepID=UPI000995C832|nr:CKLF-like MARVEL transmembrane domain-containing protein 8 [Pseudomyrmex gracilis]